MKNPIRRILALLPLLSLLLSVSAQAMVGVEYDDAPDTMHIMDLGVESTALLPVVGVYDDQFADVDAAQWFYPYVAASYEYGLIGGRSYGFAPDEDITVAELLTLSARLRAAYAGDDIPAPAEGEVWYAPYVAYLAERELLPADLADFDMPATRAELAGIFALSLPEDCFDGQNALLVTDAYTSGDYITDVDEYTPNQPQILWLYRQGLLGGMDMSGSYWPDKPTTRAEVAAVVTRMADPSLRIALDWVVLPPWSAAGATLASLVTASDAPPTTSPAYDDTAAVDALVRRMLAADDHSIALQYRRSLTDSDARTLARVFTDRIKAYCEQMYNSVECVYYMFGGSATLTFSATACTGSTAEECAAQLTQYREAAMAKAIEVHDMLWETGQLTADMSEYEIARVYYLWLCDNCSYDYAAVNDDYSLSHIAYNALLNGTAVCDGYTGAYNLFLKLEGIDCYALPKESINHIWTVATLDGVEYHIDVTWGDQTGWIDMRYFAMTPAESDAVHTRQR